MAPEPRDTLKNLSIIYSINMRPTHIRFGRPRDFRVLQVHPVQLATRSSQSVPQVRTVRWSTSTRSCRARSNTSLRACPIARSAASARPCTEPRSTAPIRRRGERWSTRTIGGRRKQLGLHIAAAVNQVSDRSPGNRRPELPPQRPQPAEPLAAPAAVQSIAKPSATRTGSCCSSAQSRASHP
jgi:hypothetical protein